MSDTTDELVRQLGEIVEYVYEDGSGSVHANAPFKPHSRIVRAIDRLTTIEADNRLKTARALREAEERVRAEERAHAAEALRLAQAMQEKAVASAVAAERERIKARLREPDEGTVEALAAYQQADEDGVMALVSRQVCGCLSDPQEGE